MYRSFTALYKPHFPHMYRQRKLSQIASKPSLTVFILPVLQKEAYNFSENEPVIKTRFHLETFYLMTVFGL